ncbi:MAG: ABC transporter substrate-binding protein [Chloroflexi bacterium]|nr:ABC transporter substrate-binding protein [Chloroflexota bacterium]
MLAKSIGILLALGTLVAFNACGLPAGAPKTLTKLTVGYTAAAAAHVPTWMAKDAGLFEKYGLDVEIIYTAGTKGAASVVSGDAQIVDGAAEHVVSANLAGADLVVVSSAFKALQQYLYTSKEINNVQDLKGKTVGITRSGTVTDFAMRWHLQRAGLVPRTDVAILETGGGAESLAALQAGVIQGAYLSPPITARARKLGFKELTNIYAEGLDYSYFSNLVRKPYLSANKDVLRNYLKAYVEGIALVKKDKARSKQVIGQYLKMTDEEDLEESYNLTGDVLEKVPYTNPAGVKLILTELAKMDPKAQTMRPEDVYDNSLVKELDDSGFIKKLYQ